MAKHRTEIGQEMCGFVKETGTRNVKFITNMLLERLIDIQKYVHLRFINYAKVFEIARHMDLLDLSEKLYMFGKCVRIVKHSYWNETVCIHIENIFST